MVSSLLQPRLMAIDIAVKQAYDIAGLGPGDIAICELHDCFSIASTIAAGLMKITQHSADYGDLVFLPPTISPIKINRLLQTYGNVG